MEQPEPNQPRVLDRADHSISRKRIEENSLKVLYRLRHHGYKAYLVGGGVRDLLLGLTPKDFDVATDATPNQVKKLFRNCFLVGRRFRLAHIRFAGNSLIEVATFRRQATEEDLPDEETEQRFYSENVFGTPEEDAFRRDFTINGLFYDIDSFQVIDYVGGLHDLERKTIRVIGDPLVRFTEDPVRMLRALEFTARLGFKLDHAAREAIFQRAPLIAEAAPARIREELMELFRHKVAGKALQDAQGNGLLRHLIPGFIPGEKTFQLLHAIDRRTVSGVPITESFALAGLYYEEFLAELQTEGPIASALHLARELTDRYGQYFHVANGIRHEARELLIASYRFLRGRGRRGERRFLTHPVTGQALELFTLWAEVSGEHLDLINTWREAISTGPPPSPPLRKNPRRRRRRKPRPPRT